MRIVLSGIESNNKGAELMLYSILQEIERKFPEAEVYVPLHAIRQGLDYIHTNVKLKDKPFADFKRKHAKQLHIYGILSRLHMGGEYWGTDMWPVSKAAYFIDASGFGFSDQWGTRDYTIIGLEKELASYKKQGTKIIYLPQAFGPFEQELTRRLVNVVGKYADVIMPREKVSYDYLVKAGLDTKKLRIFTDFTSLMEGECPKEYAHLAGGVCIIPNARMIDKGIVDYDYYISALTKIAEYVKSQGKLTYILSHEIKSDDPLCDKLSESLKGKVETVTGLNALEVKGLISTAYMCITSRFHGVASALNSCVPCLATSWSHKYAELFADYNLTDCVLDLKDMDKSLESIASYIDPETNKAIRKHLSEQLPGLKDKTREMWEVVWSV